jgi:replicative DNA helicase
MRFDNEYARFQNLDDYAVGQKYVERPSRMNNNHKTANASDDPSHSSSDFISQNKDPLPF